MIDTLAIDTGIEPEYENRLIASAKKVGWEVICPRRIPFTEEILDVSPSDLENPNVWYHGDIATAKVVQKTLPWQVHAPWDYLDLFNLLGYVLDEDIAVVNAVDFSLTTVKEFGANPAPFFDKLAEDNHVFVKSTAADKSISGKCVDRAEFVRQWELLTFYDPDPETRLIVSRPRRIRAESRFLVVEDKVVTGSYYKTGGQGLNLRAPAALLSEAQTVLERLLALRYRPPVPSWVLDLAQTENGWEVLETGATSCCGLYACDTDAFVKALNEVSYGCG